MPRLADRFDVDAIGVSSKERERLIRLRRAQTDLFWLATEILGYDRLTEDFHSPMLSDIDRQRSSGVDRCLELWPRGHYKTTIRIAQIVQDLLTDPDDTIMCLHAVEEEVNKMVQECGYHFHRNDELRALRPEMMPAKQNRRFLKASNFTVKRSRYARQPSVLGKSSGSEITGAHCNKIYPDDIVGRNTIEDSGLPKVKSWWRNTVLPVLNPGGIIRATGTRWDIDDPYGAWLKDSHWSCRVRAALETDGKPDYKGKPVLFPMREIQRRRREMGESDFAFQMMNDPSPAADKPWFADQCEHLIGIRPDRENGLPGAAGPGAVFVLSDPAPAKVGSMTGEKEKQRGDGRKDDWAICTVKIKKHKEMQIAVLLEIRGSADWTRTQGLDEACRQMRRWHTNKFFNEAYGGLQADWTPEMRKAAMRNGVPLYLGKDGQLPKFKNSYAKGAKNLRFTTLADWASTGRFYICMETCDEQEIEKLLSQCRGWIPLPNGRNTLPYDDYADVAARCTDSALQEFAPQAHSLDDLLEDEGWDDEVYDYSSRYCLA